MTALVENNVRVMPFSLARVLVVVFNLSAIRSNCLLCGSYKHLLGFGFLLHLQLRPEVSDERLFFRGG